MHMLVFRWQSSDHVSLHLPLFLADVLCAELPYLAGTVQAVV